MPKTTKKKCNHKWKQDLEIGASGIVGVTFCEKCGIRYFDQKTK